MWSAIFNGIPPAVRSSIEEKCYIFSQKQHLFHSETQATCFILINYSEVRSLYLWVDSVVRLAENLTFFLDWSSGTQRLEKHKTETVWMLKNERPTWCHLLFYFTSYVLNMFRTLIYPSSVACDCVVELPHGSSCSQFVVCWRFGAAGFEWCSICRLKQNSCASAWKTSTTQNQISNTQRTENKTTDVVIQQQQSQAPDDGYINVRNMFST